MKKFSAGLLLSLLSFGGCAQKGIDIKSSGGNKTLLWKISGNGLAQPSYLFGTIHMLCKEDAILSANMKKVINKADEIYFEVDMDNMLEMMMVAMTQMKMRDDTTLRDLLTKEEFEKVKTFFENRDSPIPFSMIETMKPFFAVSTLMEKGDLACESMAIMEQVIMTEAKEHGKEVKGLESMSYQAGILDSIPYKMQAQQLLSYIDDIEKNVNSGDNETKELMKAYNEQDLEKLETMINKNEIGMSNYADILLYNRNRNWVKKLKKLLPDQTLLIAVGAGHLPGTLGVIELLRKEGYKVEPIENKVSKLKEI
jgi:uncharacterized protein YbaP (TraB family)